MKIIAYIFFIILLLILVVWFLLPFITRYVLKLFARRMQDYMEDQEDHREEGKQGTIISNKTNTGAQQTDFEELN